jgi:hypothetical protein
MRVLPHGPYGPAWLGIALFAVTLALTSPSAVAEEGVLSRAEYAARVEPICKQSTEASERILEGVRSNVKKDRLPAAGQQFLRASSAFGKAIERIVTVPRSPTDEDRLLHWIDLLRVVEENLRKVGVDLKKEQRVRANHDAIRAERSGNAANNAGFGFPFRYCRLSPSMFS